MLNWILTRFRQPSLDDLQRARELLHAIDRENAQVDPERIRAVARALGLAVGAHASPRETLEQIRTHLARRADS